MFEVRYLGGDPAVLQAPMLDDLVLDLAGHSVPHPAQRRRAISKRLGTPVTVSVVPTVEGPAWDAELIQRAFCWQVRLLDQLDDLQLP